MKDARCGVITSEYQKIINNFSVNKGKIMMIMRPIQMKKNTSLCEEITFMSTLSENCSPQDCIYNLI